jgi:NADP-dependent aldehyde dehydrogenase
MGSVNPILVTPAAAAARGSEIAAGLAAAITTHAGQLCTKPGLVFLADDPAGRELVAELGAAVEATAAQRMLYPALREGFARGLAEALADPRVAQRACGGPAAGDDLSQASILLELRAAELGADDPLLEELFGPAAVVVWVDGEAGLLAAAREHVGGNLTASVHAEPGEEDTARPLLAPLARRVGRLIWNGFPTGVTVGHATVHGGPFPATTASMTTSVGMTAMRRFLRPVGYQDLPDELLPPALRDANPLGLLRQVDGEWTREPVSRRG